MQLKWPQLEKLFIGMNFDKKNANENIFQIICSHLNAMYLIVDICERLSKIILGNFSVVYGVPDAQWLRKEKFKKYLLLSFLDE